MQCNSDLRRLLIGTGSRSILVIEDIDCSVELQNRESGNEPKTVEDDKVLLFSSVYLIAKIYASDRLIVIPLQITLSGLLNFIDGLWSTCGDERIIVFATNNKDRLDPALLRPGRMDVHLPMSYCSFNGFKTLTSNYLQIQDHPLFRDIDDLLQKAQATPAEVARELMNSDDVEVALQGLIRFLQGKKEDNNGVNPVAQGIQ